ncbi:MAG TPA: DUF1854 domain-containing protein [Noviherbaspirillum sp.]|uniref:cyanophycin metabolism-associated DUF1854 family protein n=1 Tax=Noviherbaspirillum sp. TaxID=1926288 RepID=UPI002B48659D|nr:DUF1854 domain-containing protein [Noviherbaspirillum sp.]HJV87520.1 DUF1854 domain-containing protein [Noviherbaspirillum sp.]
MNKFELSRNAFGKLVFTSSEGVHEGVVPVRAFPIAAPDSGIALVDADGHELAWIDSLNELPAPARALLEEELKNREFLPVIKSIRHVSTFAVPSTWEVETDRGEASFVLKGEEDIRRIAQDTLLIADSHGVQFLIRDVQALDKASRKLLDRFL